MSINRVVGKLHQLKFDHESAYESGNLWYMPQGLTITTLPHSDIPGQRFVRYNGACQLELVAMHDDVGLPYGPMARMIMAWLTKEAVRSGSRNLLFDRSMAAFLRELGYASDGGAYGTISRLKEQTVRLSCCAFSFRDSRRKDQEKRSQMLVSDHSENWFSSTTQNNSRFKYEICLSQVFFDEIVGNPVPVDMRVLKLLKRSSLRMDIYIWLTHRMFYLREPSKIPWSLLPHQFGCGYPDTAAGRRAFKKKFRKELQFVTSYAYTEANVDESETHLILNPSPVPVPPRN